MNNSSQELRNDLAISICSKKTIVKPPKISAQELHKYVLGLIGVFGIMVLSCPIAMNRVAQKEKFAPYKSHVKSLTAEYKPVKPLLKKSSATTNLVRTSIKY